MTVIVWAAAAAAAGTALGSGRPGLAPPAAIASVVVLSAALGVRRIAIALGIVALAFAATASAAWRTAAAHEAILPSAPERVADVCGTARALGPRSVVVRAERIEIGGRSWRTSEPARIASPGVGEDARKVRVGERICAKGEIVAPREHGDLPLVVARSIENAPGSSRVRLAAGTVRGAFARVAQRALPATQAGLLLGMTDGDVTLLDEATVEAFRTTGLAHLVAVSGSNVAVLLVVVMLIARRTFGPRRILHAAFALPFLAFFAFLTGLEASVLRAVVTAAIALVVTVEGRTTDAIRLAAFAFTVLVLTSPELLFHPGFQLSFAATLGLIVWGRPLTDAITARLPQRPAFAAVAACIGTTLAAQAAAAPLLAMHFGRIPAVGGIANVVVAPLAPVVMIGGIVLLGVAALVPGAGWAPVLMRFPLDAILWTARTFAGLPSASVDAGVLIGIAVCAAVAAIAVRSARARAGAVAIAFVAVAATGGGAIAARACDGPSVTALDVGQGTAVLLRSAGHAVLVDGGPEDGLVVDDLDAQGIGRLDAVFVSHPHADHTQGLVDALGSLDIGTVHVPVTIGWGQGAKVVRAARDAGVPVRTVAAGDALAFGSLRVEVVFPEPADAPPVRDEEAVHAFSLVLRAEVGPMTVLLPGDVGAEEERDLQDPQVVGASVLVAPHHGSKDLDPAFVEAVDPRIILVTVGEDNRYGHPAPEAMRVYDAHASVFRTDMQGTITLCASEREVAVTTERNG